MADLTLSFEPRADKWALIHTTADGTKVEMILSDAEVLTIVQSSPLWRDRILSKLSRTGVEARSTTIVAQVELNTDIFREAIHLRMIGENGASMGFELPLEVARPLADRLPIRVAEIEAEKPTKQ
jgi:hypothetical protein